MALPALLQAIQARFRGSNNNAFNSSANPLGLGQGGHRQNFNPRLKDMADALDWVSGAVDAVDADATATAADRVQTSKDLANTKLDVIATAQNVTAAAGEVTKAQAEVTNAKAEVQNAKTEVTNAKAWATTAENTEVAPGLFSALHWAKKALAAAAAFSIPPVSAADALKVLRVKADGSGYMLDAVGEVYRLARTANTVIVKADKGKLVDITSGTFAQTFAAAATLLDGWSCYVRNSGAGDITLDPNGSETIDGLASFIMYPGETRLIQCDGLELRSVVLKAGSKAFSSSGTLIWPPGYSGGVVECSGAGGGGGHNSGGGGGGGGQSAPKVVRKVAGTSHTAVVGAAGQGGTPSVASTPGGASSFGTVGDGCWAGGGQAGGGNQGSGGAGGSGGRGITMSVTPAGLQGGFTSGQNAGSSAEWGGGSGGTTNASSSTGLPGGCSIYGGGGGGSGYGNSTASGGGGYSGSNTDRVGVGEAIPPRCGGYGANIERAAAAGGFPSGGGGGGANGSYTNGANGAGGQVMVSFF